MAKDKNNTDPSNNKDELKADSAEKKQEPVKSGFMQGMKNFFASPNELKKQKDDKENKEGKKHKDKNDLPGFFSFLKQNWKSQSTDFELQDAKAHKERFWSKFNRIYNTYQEVKEDEVERLEIYESIAIQATFSKEFLVLLSGSTLIASFGLLQGSTGVIIGAMLIAPLMMPILGFSLGSIWGDANLIKKSLLTLLVGSAFSFVLAFLLSALLPGTEFNSEILARTNPNIFDIIIAITSGLVGAYAYVNPNISSSISGVAIAVALMPPLCTIGIAFGKLDFRAAFGAALLYIINLVGISLAASFVFWRMKVHPTQSDQEEVKGRARKNVYLSAAVLFVIAVPLGYFMLQTYFMKLDKTRIRNLMLESLSGVEIVSLDLSRYRNNYSLKSVFILSQKIPRERIVELKKNIQANFSRKIQFQLIPLLTYEPIKQPIELEPKNKSEEKLKDSDQKKKLINNKKFKK